MTPRERAERLIDLTGEIKLADQLVAECERDVTERWRQYELAMGAAQKQRERRLALYVEAKRLGEEAKADFDALVPVSDETARMVVEGLEIDHKAITDRLFGRDAARATDAPEGDGGSGGIAFDQAVTDAFNAATTPQDTGDKTHIFGNGRLP